MAERFERLDFEFGFERLDFVVVIGLILVYGLWWFASVGLGYGSSGCDVGLQTEQLNSSSKPLYTYS